MTGHVATLIGDPVERERRHQRKRDRILRFLRLNTWSTTDILREALELRSRQAAHDSLHKLRQEGLIREAWITVEHGMQIHLWGITAHGAAMSAEFDESLRIRLFEPSKIKLATLGHTLDLQRLQLRAEQAGWQWQPVVGEYARSEAKYADALAVQPGGVKVAIEVERTVKTIKRYTEILISHLAARKAGKWDWIYYLSPTASVRDRVQRAFSEIRRVNWHGQTVVITSAHLNPFKFYSYADDWTSSNEE